MARPERARGNGARSKRLSDPDGGVDVALVQGDIAHAGGDTADVVSLGAMS